MSVKGHYQTIIREIMEELCIEALSHKPSHQISKNATFANVIQYTDAYLGKELNTQSDYRYDIYRNMLANLAEGGGRIAHIDIGCGAGPFSWAFVDWATEKGVELNRVSLYGLDHCPAMLCLAQEIRSRLSDAIPDYPDLHYYQEIDSLLDKLKEKHQEDKNYTITFGHVLVQVYEQEHPDEAINQFAQIVSQVYNMISDNSSCNLVAVDASTGNWSIKFDAAWDSFQKKLKSLGVDMKSTRGTSVRIASLYPAWS